MGQGYLIDTNVSIDYLSDRLPEKSGAFIDTIDKQLSVISRIELLAWPAATPAQLEVLQLFIDTAKIFPINEPVIMETIRIRKNFRVKLPDAIIAATALVFDLSLVTHNVGDFKDILGLTVIDSYKL